MPNTTNDKVSKLATLARSVAFLGDLESAAKIGRKIGTLAGRDGWRLEEAYEMLRIGNDDGALWSGMVDGFYDSMLG